MQMSDPQAQRSAEAATTIGKSRTAPAQKAKQSAQGRTAVASHHRTERHSHVNTTRTVTGSAGRRINPDSLRTLWFTVALVGVLGLTSFMVSFNGLHDVAAWVGLPWWMRWAVPIFIDIAILAYSMAAVIHRARGEATWPTWLTPGVFTGVSVVANAAHALAKGEGETSAVVDRCGDRRAGSAGGVRGDGADQPTGLRSDGTGPGACGVRGPGGGSAG